MHGGHAGKGPGRKLVGESLGQGEVAAQAGIALSLLESELGRLGSELGRLEERLGLHVAGANVVRRVATHGRQVDGEAGARVAARVARARRRLRALLLCALVIRVRAVENINGSKTAERSARKTKKNSLEAR